LTQNGIFETGNFGPTVPPPAMARRGDTTAQIYAVAELQSRVMTTLLSVESSWQTFVLLKIR